MICFQNQIWILSGHPYEMVHYPATTKKKLTDFQDNLADFSHKFSLFSNKF